ncbi:FAD-binding oxidoreductase [Desulforamulus ruminis]|uniref:FAD-binding oxidoreductase n=1 Tax=Desulforamulus ruminis TaxID=1564 RepID=UPI003B5BCCB0
MILLNYEGLTGRVITPCDPEYALARQEWNKAIDTFPRAIVYCRNAQDVANAICWSRKHCIPLRVRSGAHHYEGYSSGTGTLVIDTSLMNHIKVDTCQNTVTVEAGTRLKDLYQTLSACGYAFAGGTCPTVGISGLVLGGGIGLSTRYLGLTADNLIEATMIDANGNQLTVNQNCNRDLFWALRGAGGGNFGVVVSYQFKIEAVKKITLIQLRWENKPARLAFLEVWQEWLKGLDRRISGFGGIYKKSAYLNSFFYGTPAEAKEILAPFLSIPGLTLRTIECVDFIDAVNIIGARYERSAFQSPGGFVFRDFSREELEKFIQIMDQAPSDTTSRLAVYSLGGAVRDIPETGTAFFYRSANYIMAVSSEWQNKSAAPAHQAWVAEGFKYLKTLTCGSYVNFPYNRLKDYQEAYFGEYVEILQYIKRKYDPENIFCFPQSIKPAESVRNDLKSFPFEAE